MEEDLMFEKRNKGNEKFMQMEMEDFSPINKKKVSDYTKYENIPSNEVHNIKEKEEFYNLNKRNEDDFSTQIVNIIKYYCNKIYNNLKNKIKNNRKNESIAFVLSFISLILYYIGLEGCVGDEAYCLTKIGISFYVKIITLNLISIFCVCALLVLMSFRKIICFHLLYLIPLFIILMYSDQGTTLSHHGYYNCIGYIILLILLYPLSCFIYMMIRLIRNKKYYIYVPILVFIFFIVVRFMIYIKVNTKCHGWENGLNNTKIYNNENEYACQIKFPKTCYINIVDNKLNMTKIVNKVCDKRSTNEKKLLFESIKNNRNPYITQRTKRIGYPRINKGGYPQEEQDGLIKLSTEVLQNLVDMDNLPPNIVPDRIPEVYVDFNNYPEDPTSKYGKIHFNIIKNETLIKERKEKSSNNDVIFNNIVVLFIDTLSRVHLNRKMPKLRKWLEEHMKYDSEDFINYQFLKFHSLGVHTEINMKPAYFGESVMTSNGVHIVNHLKEKGYITAQADNYCSPEPYQLRQSFDHSNVTYGYFDHELISLFCEPNYFKPKNPFPIDKGNCAVIRRCLYGYDTFHYIFEYSKLFWRTYEGNRRFLRLSSMDSHELTGELVNIMDEPLTNFLEDLYTKGDLKDTILFFFSDHGNHMSLHLSLLPADDVQMEKVMPFFFLFVPKKSYDYQNKNFLDEYYENLHKNQQSFVNCFDIHDTIMHIAFNKYEKDENLFSKNGTSLFYRVNDKKRTCDDFPEIFDKRSPGTLTCNCYRNKK